MNLDPEDAGGLFITLAVFTIIVSLFAAAVHGEWVEIPPVRDSPYEGVIGEIEDRMPRPGRYTGHANRNLWAHETCHFLNSRLSPSGWAFYLPGGWALRVPSQNGVTLAQVASRTQKHGPAFDLYVVRLRSFNDRVPLVLFDELSAYICGLVAGIETGYSRVEIINDYNLAVEMHSHCLVLAGLLRQTGYSHTDELIEFLTVTGRYLRELRPYVEKAR